MRRCRADRYTRKPFCAQTFLILLNRQTGRLTHRGFFSLGASSATSVASKVKNFGHLKQVTVPNGCCGTGADFFRCSACAFDMCLLNYSLTYLLTYLLMINQELINGVIDQWSKRLLFVFNSQDGHVEHRFR